MTGRNAQVFGESSRIRHAQDPEGGTGKAGISTPVVGRINDDFLTQPVLSQQIIRGDRANFIDDAGPVRTGGARQAETWILAERDPDIAAIQGRGLETHPYLTGTGFRDCPFFNLYLIGTAELAENDGFHGVTSW